MGRDAASSDTPPLAGRGRRALSGGLLYAATGAGARLSYFVALPFVTHAVAPVVFGQYALIRVLLPVLRNFADLGTSTAAVRYGSGLPPERGEVFASVVVSRLITASAVALVVLLVARAVVPAFFVPALLSVVALFFLALTDALANVCRAEERHGSVTLSHAASALAELAAIIVLVARLELGLVGLAWSLALRFVAGFVVILPRAWPLLGRPSFARYRGLLRFGAPAAFAQLVSTAGALDRWLVERLSSLSEVALYHLASMPAVAVEVLEQAVTLAAEPWVYGAEPGERPRALGRLVAGYFAAASATAALISLFAPELLRIVAPPSYAHALPVLPWLAFAAVAQGGFRVVGMSAGVSHQTRPWAIAGLVELGLAALLLIVLVPHWGATAAGAGRFAASLVGVSLCHLLARRVSGIELRIRGWLAFSVVAALTCFGVLSARAGVVPGAALRAGVALALALAAGALFGLSLRPSPRSPAPPASP